MRLEPITDCQHLYDLVEMRNHKSVRPTLRTDDLTTKEGQKNWLNSIDKNSNKYYFIIDRVGLIGYCGLDKFSSKSAEISLLIDEKYNGRGYGKQAINMLLRIGFNRLELNLIYGEAYMSTSNYKFWQKIGFKEEAILRARKLWEGRFYSSMIFSMTKKEYDRWKK